MVLGELILLTDLRIKSTLLHLLVEVFNNSHFVKKKPTLIMKCFILICSVETLSTRRIYTGVHQVCQIEFTPGVEEVWFRSKLNCSEFKHPNLMIVLSC